jgi:site-specific DNA recombinase
MPHQPNRDSCSPARVVVVYERVSDKKQDLDRQAEQRRRAKEDHLDRELVLLQDDGISAFKVPIFERKGGRKLCELIEAGRVEALYADAQDRLSRGSDVEWVNFRALCEVNKTRIVIDGRELESGFAGDLVGYVKNKLARQESVEKSHRVRGGQLVRARKGLFTGGPAPLGYRYRDTTLDGKRGTGPLIEEPAEAAIVRRIFAEYVGGRSQRQIARDLDCDGIRTKRGGKWSQAIVRRVLANPTYRGVVHAGKDEEGESVEYPGEHPVIIDPETWEKANRLRESLARTKGGGKGPVPKGNHLFRHGHLRCGRCGEAMIPRTIRPRSKTGRWYEAYLCYGRVRGGPEACEQAPVRREHVDEAVFDYFSAIALDVDATRARFTRAHDERLAEARACRERAERDLLRVQAEVEKVERDYFAGDLSAATYERLLAKKGHEQDALEAEARLFREREAEVVNAGSLSHADEAVLSYLAKLRAAVVFRVTDADGLDAVRAALVSTFESFMLHHRDSEAARTKLLDPDLDLIWSPYYLEPKIREEAIVGYYEAEDLDSDDTVSLPMARRMPLLMRENADTHGFTT